MKGRIKLDELKTKKRHFNKNNTVITISQNITESSALVHCSSGKMQAGQEMLWLHFGLTSSEVQFITVSVSLKIYYFP